MTIEDRGKIITTIARRIMQSKGLPVTVRGGIQNAALQGWDEATRNAAPVHYEFGSACGSAYDRGFWAGKQYGKIPLEKILSCL